MMLRLIVNQPGKAQRALEWAALTASGCLLGSAPDVDLPLASPPGTRVLGRIQAVVRVEGGQCSIENLSALGQVSINGHALSTGQTAGLRPGDSLQVGAHHLKLEAVDASSGMAALLNDTQEGGMSAAGTPTNDAQMAAAQADEIQKDAGRADETHPVPICEEETPDLFNSLLGGPGVIPVGSPIPALPDAGHTHVLSDTRPTVLHDDEPLLDQHGTQGDIGAVLGSSGQEKS